MNRWRNSGPCLAVALLLPVRTSRVGPDRGRGHGLGDGGGRVRRGPPRRQRPPDRARRQQVRDHGARTARTRFSGVPAGTYKLTVALIGFGTAAQDGVTVAEGRPAQVPARHPEDRAARRGGRGHGLQGRVLPGQRPGHHDRHRQRDARSLAGPELRRPAAHRARRSTSSRCRPATSTSPAGRGPPRCPTRSSRCWTAAPSTWTSSASSSGTSCPATRPRSSRSRSCAGPASAVWGANALTGVVNIITKTPREVAGHQHHPHGRRLRPRRGLAA